MHKQIIYLMHLCMHITQVTCVRPKSLFWFRSNNETQTKIGRYFSTDTVTNTETTFQRENLVSDSMVYFFHSKKALITKFVAKF